MTADSRLCLVLGLLAGLGVGCRAERPPPEAASPVPGAPDTAAAEPAVGTADDAGPEPEAEVRHAASDAGPPAVSGAGDVGAADPGLPLLPDGPFVLPVEGFEPAVAVPPAESFQGVAPPIVILHGNFDRPEWQCGTWAAVGTAHGWLLCPRGSPRTDVDPTLDRWTWDGPEAAAREVSAAVRALRTAWPDRLRDEGAVLVGFSLGARYAPAVAAADVGIRFESLVLVEQGFAVTSADVQAAREAGVARVVYACGERTECPARAETASARWERAGVAVERLVMEGVGHAYPEKFDPLAERVFEALAALP
ncbi:MAG: hypothetical protein JXB32_15715 [Deltaproteobacteria bacterium]|nr:hypothetical protein [Deltaproteobacteria bacterium]